MNRRGFLAREHAELQAHRARFKALREVFGPDKG